VGDSRSRNRGSAKPAFVPLTAIAARTEQRRGWVVSGPSQRHSRAKGLRRFRPFAVAAWNPVSAAQGDLERAQDKKHFVEGQDRGQLILLPECLDGYVGEENPVPSSMSYRPAAPGLIFWRNQKSLAFRDGRNGIRLSAVDT
jgi:hypothetical protein